MKEKEIRGRIEAIEQSAKNRLLTDYRALFWEQLVVVNSPHTRLAIDDISYKTKYSIEDDIEMLQLVCKGWLEIYDASNLTFALEQKLRPLVTAINPRKTVVIFPGNGAQVVKELLDGEILDKVASVSVPTQRMIDTKTKTLTGVQIENKNAVRKVLSDISPETILVLDDVIATGTTLTMLQQAFPTRKAEWLAASLMMLSPLQRKGKLKNDSGVEGYQSIISPVIYQGITGTPPLNSLSTLIENSEKSQLVRRNYMRDYVEDEGAFQAVIGNMQKKLKGGYV